MPEPVEFHAPAWARQFRNHRTLARPLRKSIRRLAVGDRVWRCSSTIDDSEEIRDELVRIIWDGSREELQPQAVAEAKNYKLVWSAMWPANGNPAA